MGNAEPPDVREGHDRRWALWALDCWGLFPATDEPRPLVLRSTVRIDGGFRDGAAKLAYRRGAVVGRGSIPEEVVEVVREAGTEAVEDLDIEPLVVDHVAPEVATFWTDRGPQPLQAWRLSGPQLPGGLVSLDPAIAATRWKTSETWRPPKPFDGERHLEFRAVHSPDDTNLLVSFIGGGATEVGYCTADVIETEHAIAVLPQRVEMATICNSDAPRTAPARFRSVQVHLSRPLGGRVLVDLDGSACAVSRYDGMASGSSGV